MRARVLIWPLLLLGGGGLLAYTRYLRPIPVTTAAVQRGTAVEAVYASGTIEAEDRVDVKARMSGPLAELHVREGDHVDEGQLIARIDAPTLDLDVSRGRVDLAAAQQRAQAAPQIAALEAQAQSLLAQLGQARADLSRAEKLFASGAGVPLDVERARTQVASLEAQIASNRAQQEDLRIGLRSDALRQRAGVASLKARARDSEIRAPMTGAVLSRRVEKGEVVAVNQNLLRIGDLTKLWIESRVDESDIGRVRVGMAAAVRLYAFEGEVFAAHVMRILPDADRDRKSFEVDLKMDAPPTGLLPGMTAEINVVIRKRPGVLLLPADALHGDHVVVVGSDGRLHRRPVRLGIRDLTQLEITEGLREGEQVVLDDEERLEEGRRARPVPRPPERPGVARPAGDKP